MSGGDRRVDGWWAASYVVLWILVIFLTVLVVALARQIGTLHLRLGPRGALELDDEGPALGDTPPPNATTDVTGRAVTIGGPGEAQLLLFASVGCRTCDDVLVGVTAVARGAELTPYVIGEAEPDEVRRAFGAYDATLVSDRFLGRKFNVPGTPFAVVLDDRGVVLAKGTANNLEQLEGLVDTALQRAARDTKVRAP